MLVKVLVKYQYFNMYIFISNYKHLYMFNILVVIIGTYRYNEIFATFFTVKKSNFENI